MPNALTAARVRKITARVTVGTFTVAALIGIAILLLPGQIGQTETRILLTTLLVGMANALLLCCLTTAGRRPAQRLGIAGAVATLVAFLIGMTLTWSDLSGDHGWVWRGFGVSSVIAGTIAQCCLLLLTTADVRRSVRWVRVGALTAAAALAALLCAVILDGRFDSETFARVVGVVAVLDALGTVVLVALTRLAPREQAAATASAADATATVTLSGPMAGLVIRRAADTGTDPDTVVALAVDRYLREVTPIDRIDPA